MTMINLASFNAAAVNGGGVETYVSTGDPAIDAEIAAQYTNLRNLLATGAGKRVSEVVDTDTYTRLSKHMGDHEVVAATWKAVAAMDAAAFYTMCEISVPGIPKFHLENSRLISMIDRNTSILGVPGGGVVWRPCLTSGYNGPIDYLLEAWLEYMFSTKVVVDGIETTPYQAALNKPAKRSKYPQIPEAFDGLTTQVGVLLQLVWDQVALYLANQSANGEHSAAFLARKQNQVVQNKLANTVRMIATVFKTTVRVVCVQEMSEVMLTAILGRLGDDYGAVVPNAEGANTQFSCLVYDKTQFTPKVVTHDVYAAEQAQWEINASEYSKLVGGDGATRVGPHSVVAAVFGTVLVASVHASTGGTSTLPAFDAVRTVATELGIKYVIGADMNTVAKDKPGKLARTAFDAYAQKRGATTSHHHTTTMRIRTPLGVQPSKAASVDDSGNPIPEADPKDMFVGNIDLHAEWRDNQGGAGHVEGMLMPNQWHPTDHEMIGVQAVTA